MQASGKKDLESISEYAMNTRRCRRTVFAEAFSQQWEKASNGDSDAGCSHGCDVCDPSPSAFALCRNIMVVDMLPMAKLVFEVLLHYWNVDSKDSSQHREMLILMISYITIIRET